MLLPDLITHRFVIFEFYCQSDIGNRPTKSICSLNACSTSDNVHQLFQLSCLLFFILCLHGNFFAKHKMIKPTQGFKKAFKIHRKNKRFHYCATPSIFLNNVSFDPPNPLKTCECVNDLNVIIENRTLHRPLTSWLSLLYM